MPCCIRTLHPFLRLAPLIFRQNVFLWTHLHFAELHPGRYAVILLELGDADARARSTEPVPLRIWGFFIECKVRSRVPTNPVRSL